MCFAATVMLYRWSLDSSSAVVKPATPALSWSQSCLVNQREHMEDSELGTTGQHSGRSLTQPPQHSSEPLLFPLECRGPSMVIQWIEDLLTATKLYFFASPTGPSLRLLAFLVPSPTSRFHQKAQFTTHLFNGPPYDNSPLQDLHSNNFDKGGEGHPWISPIGIAW